jgi:hypothetical protein
VAAAIALGYAGRALFRNGKPSDTTIPSITSLDQLLALF